MKRKGRAVFGLILSLSMVFDLYASCGDVYAASENPDEVIIEEAGYGEDEAWPVTDEADAYEGSRASVYDDVEFRDETEVEKEVRESFNKIADEFPILALVYRTDSVALTSEPAGGAVTATVNIGDQLFVYGYEIDDNGSVWFNVGSEDGPTGYISAAYIVTNDERFRNWKEQELGKISDVELSEEGSTSAEIKRYFPEGYQAGLIALSKKHPNWTFVPANTNQDWSYIISKEREGARSLVQLSAEDSWKSKEAGDYDPSTGQYTIRSGTNWVRASETAVSYCLNPMNYLDEKHIFAFEQLAYNSSYQNESGVAAILRGSFMDGVALPDGSGGLYSSVFMEIGRDSGVSPYHLASRVLQEQGKYGGSSLIQNPPYNYFNIGASGSTKEQVIAKGRERAAQSGWVTAYKSIAGGAAYIGTGYINKGQDTVYFQKFDVLSGKCSHQYMQNIQAPLAESVKVSNAYADVMDIAFVFRIPIYKNAPAAGNVVSVDKEKAEAFVKRLYTIILDREAEQAGLEYWIEELSTGKTAGELVSGFFFSPEFTNKKMSNEDFVSYAYTAILGRTPDLSGKEYWVKRLNSGVTRRCILNGFVESTEFTKLCEEYGVVRGSMTDLRPADKNAEMTMLVTRLYNNILGRGSDEEGLNYWTGNLQNGLTGCSLLQGFFDSKEFNSKTYTDEQYLTIMYQTILGREPDASGKKYWLNRMKKEGRKILLEGFAYSPEFGKNCADAGITVGNL